LEKERNWRGDGHTIFFRVPETSLPGLRERKMGLYYGLGRISFQEETPAPGTRRVIIGGEATKPPENRKATQGGGGKSATRSSASSIILLCLNGRSNSSNK
jgi:hypothetical protein